jgi:bacillithiol biosynthesis deacetylase BshB1
MGVDILAFGAHADDVEIGAGGCLAKHTAAGKQAVICDLTQAELSSNGTVTTRAEEARLAAACLQIAERINLGLPDRGLFHTDTYIRQIVQVIRAYQPHTILAPYWQDRHPDHEHSSQLIREAVFSAGIRNYAAEIGAAYKPLQVFYYFINDFALPDFCIDVTSTYEQKMKALTCYGSQFASGDDRVETPLNSGYLEQISSRESLFGSKIGKKYAEGFMVRGPLFVEYFM